MKTIMNIEQLKEVKDLEAFLQGIQKIAYSLPNNKSEHYRQIEKILVKFNLTTNPALKKTRGLSLGFS